MKKKIIFLISCCLLVFLSGCHKQGQETRADKLQVVTSFFPMQAVTQEIAGDKADVTMLIKNGQDSHDFEPSAKDIARLEDADLFIYNSREMETWVPDTTKALNHVKVIEAAKDITLKSGAVKTTEGNVVKEDHDAHDHHHEHGDGVHVHANDPHTWLDPSLLKQEVNTIKEALIEADPKNKESYEQNAKNFNLELDQLDQEFKEALKGKENNQLVVEHAAFGYLAHRYGLEQVALTSVSSANEASPEKMAKLQDYIKAHDVSMIYFQAGSSSKVADVIAKDTGVKTGTLTSMETVEDDIPMNGSGYLQLMRDNLASLKESIR